MKRLSRQPDTADWGKIVVLENNCCERQEFPLVIGDNVIGRRNKGTDVDIAIESSDADLERRHCIINVRLNKQGEPVYPSATARPVRAPICGKTASASATRCASDTPTSCR